MRRVFGAGTAIVIVLLSGTLCVPAFDQDANDSPDPARTPDVVYVPTPNDVVSKMLELAKVRKNDVVYDLGCGDGRIVVTAAKKYGCKAVGFDIDLERIFESRRNVRKNGVEDLVRIEDQNIFAVDLRPATVVTLYLLPSLNSKLVPQLEKLEPGSRIISHDFRIKGHEPDKIVNVESAEDKNSHRVFLWIAPLKRSEAQPDK